MTEHYDHISIEKKWQQRWAAEKIFQTPELKKGDKKAYILNMFPYPSAAGLHVGHLLGYTGTDIAARVARMRGIKVLHPMGWDAFGLPAENYAIKSGIHPTITTEQSVKEFKRQFDQAGISYDWDREIDSSHPDYYKWTQWLFALLYERGLAYRKEGMVNWCPGCQTVLANEQVVGGLCDRCGSQVVQKKLKQWYFKITDYAERLLNDLDELNWPERIKVMQRNWIGRSEGGQLFFAVDGSQEKIEVFTTRPDTIFGATYMVLAPEHPLVDKLVTKEHEASVANYRKETSLKTELERTFLDKEKTGVFTGSFAINPATNERIPIWIADYVLASYGTGAIMAVPAHDERDFAFAQKYELPIVQVIQSENELPTADKGTLINSGEFSGRQSEEVLDDLLSAIGGNKKTTYRLRDWLVSRQRFWGAPIPVVYDQNGQEHLLTLAELPVKLPENTEFLPTGQSPLAVAKDWKRYMHPQTGEEMTREVDTLDTFVCSSWYFLRFADPHNDKEAFSKEKANAWLPVDAYIGGAEHAVLHLLYARFITKVLFDAGLIDFNEPFKKLRNNGVILGPDHRKMSKSKGNVISPDEVVKDHGADTMRTYEMFMAPFETERPWSVQGINGVRRFLERVWRLQDLVKDEGPSQAELRILHKAIKKVDEDVAEGRFNTAVSTMMEALNDFSALPYLAKSTLLSFVTILNPFAPHLTEELWEKLGGKGFCSITAWPSYDAQYLEQDEIEYPIQINGKVRAKIVVPTATSDADILKLAKEQERVQAHIGESAIIKEIVIPGRLVSLVVDKG